MITASVVKELRQISGAGMMDCKKALQEANGDTEKAMVILRKNGIAKAEKKAGRAASEARTARPTRRPTSRPTEWLIDRPADRSMHRVDRLTDRSMHRPIGRPIDLGPIGSTLVAE